MSTDNDKFRSAIISRLTDGDAENSASLKEVNPVSEKALAKSRGSQPVSRKTSQPQPPTRRVEQRLTVVKLRETVEGFAVEEPKLLQLPSRQHNRRFIGIIWFALCVLLPTALAAAYYGFYASSQYVTEFRFTVRDASMPAGSPMGGLMGLIGGSGVGSSAANNNFMVTDYLGSQQAVEELQKRIDVIKLYSRSDIDWWSRFNPHQPVENFVKYWQTKITARYDIVTGLATAEVRAFSAQDALLIANTLVSMSETLVNDISTRSQNDAVRFAESEVEKAQNRLKSVRAELTSYRDKYGIIDPTTSVTASNSALIQTQRANLAQLETQLSTLRSQKLLPNAPAIIALQNQINSTKVQLTRTEEDVAKGTNGSALSSVVGKFEQLNLEVQFAQTMVTSTMQALDSARANAAAQHLYISPYVKPTLPESSVYPRRVLSVGMVAVFAFAFWLIALMIVRSIRERFN